MPCSCCYFASRRRSGTSTWQLPMGRWVLLSLVPDAGSIRAPLSPGSPRLRGSGSVSGFPARNRLRCAAAKRTRFLFSRPLPSRAGERCSADASPAAGHAYRRVVQAPHRPRPESETGNHPLSENDCRDSVFGLWHRQLDCDTCDLHAVISAPQLCRCDRTI
jgi:hypothetical protein